MINLTDIPRLARSAGRLADITRTLAKYGLADAVARLDSRFVRRITSVTAVGRLSEGSREARIRLALTELGTTFIKLGQVLSTRRDLIGPALAEELAQLQSRVPADPFGASCPDHWTGISPIASAGSGCTTLEGGRPSTVLVATGVTIGGFAP